MRLPGETIRKIREAIKSAFPNRDELIMMLKIELNIPQSEVPDDSNYNLVVYKLVEQLERQGRIPELIKGALNERPGNPDLQKLAQEINTIHFYFSEQPLRKFFPYFLISFIVSLIVSLLVLFVVIKFFPPEKPDSKVSESNFPRVVIVDSTAGWQDSGIDIEKNDTVKIEAGGRIHLALAQIVHLAEFAKPLIVEKMSEEELKIVFGNKSQQELKEIKNNYSFPEITSKNTFYRKWIGPKGEIYIKPGGGASSDINLDDCRIDHNRPWGQLLATVFPKGTKLVGDLDPLDVLEKAHIPLSQLGSVDGNGYINFHKEGKLAFIINEAVVSPHSQDEKCKIYYKQLVEQAKEPKDNRHKLDSESIPLIWFADNVGSFHVKVTVE